MRAILRLGYRKRDGVSNLDMAPWPVGSHREDDRLQGGSCQSHPKVNINDRRAPAPRWAAWKVSMLWPCPAPWSPWSPVAVLYWAGCLLVLALNHTHLLLGALKEEPAVPSTWTYGSLSSPLFHLVMPTCPWSLLRWDSSWQSFCLPSSGLGACLSASAHWDLAVRVTLLPLSVCITHLVHSVSPESCPWADTDPPSTLSL